MGKYVTVDEKGLARANNAELLGFYETTKKGVEEATVAALSCSEELLTSFTAAIAKMQALVERSSKSELTEEIKSLDEKRDLTFSYCMSLIDTAAKSPFDNAAAAGKLLRDQAKIYRGTYADPYVEETGKLRGFINLVRAHSEMATEIAGLTESISGLEMINNTFEETFNARTAAPIPKAENDAVRRELEEVYTEIIGRANASVYLLPSDALSAFVVRQNENIHRTKAVYNQRMGRIAAKKDQDTPATNDPDAPATNE